MRIRNLTIMAIGTALIFGGCRTTEQKENDYANAYQTAIKAIEEKKKADNDLDDAELLAMQQASYPKFQEVNGEQVRMTGKFVKVSDGQEGIVLKKYNAVVAEFRQLFNANSMAKRLRDAGYDGTFVVETKEPIYYVVVATADTPEEALESVKRLRTDEKVVKKEPYPLILNAGNVTAPQPAK